MNAMSPVIKISAENWNSISTNVLSSKRVFENELIYIIRNYIDLQNTKAVHVILPHCLTTKERHVIHTYGRAYYLTTESQNNLNNIRQLHLYLSKAYVDELICKYLSNSEQQEYSESDEKEVIQENTSTHTSNTESNTSELVDTSLYTLLKSEINKKNTSLFMTVFTYGLICGIIIVELNYYYNRRII